MLTTKCDSPSLKKQNEMIFADGIKLKGSLTPILFTMVLLVSFGCSHDRSKEKEPETAKEKDSLATGIRDLEKELARKRSEGDPQRDITAKNLVMRYLEYTEQFPEAKKTPEYLFKSAGLTRSRENFEKAVKLYDRVHKQYPSFGKRAEALYLKAFVLDHDMEREKAAKKAYRSLIDSYPDHKFATEAKSRLKTIGLSDAELIERFREKASLEEKKRKKADREGS